MPSMLHKFGLEFNPFEPSAAGPPLKGTLSPPTALAERTRAILDAHQTGRGTKALIVTGEYGTGKTCLLRWLHTDVLPNRRIKSFYFDNPGVQFYDLANALLRTIGRKDFAKFIWELAGPLVSGPYNLDLFQSGSSMARQQRSADGQVWTSGFSREHRHFQEVIATIASDRPGLVESRNRKPLPP